MPAQKITVFGGSTPIAGEPAYDAAVRLGRQLAQRGYIVLTGGYIGTMEAVSRGADEAGGHVIGVTCDEIEAWRPVKANRWVREEVRFRTLRQRLYGLIDLSDAVVALPGGIGTLAEIAVLWSQLQTGASTPRPFVLIGKGWRTTIETFFRQHEEYIPPKYLALINFAEDEIAAVHALDKALNPGSSRIQSH